jgi:alkylhydroperoxidase family enzyme
VGRADGIQEENLAALASHSGNPAFTESEQAALAYAESITTSNTVSEELFDLVRRCYSDDEIIELTALITWEICAAKFNRALEIEGQGICLLPGDTPV